MNLGTDILGKALYTLLQIIGWNQVTLIYDETSDYNKCTVPFDRVVFAEYHVGERGVENDIAYFLDSRVYDFSNTRVMVMCELQCVLELLDQINAHEYKANEQGLYIFLYEWIIVTQEEHVNIIEKRIGNVTNVAVMCWDRRKIHITLKSALWKSYGREFSLVGRYQTFGWHMTSKVFPNKNLGLNGRHFNVVTNFWEPFLYLEKRRNGTEKDYTGLCRNIMDYLAAYCNFTYSFSIPADKQWGVADENGTWDGIAGDIQRKVADFSIGAFVILPTREEVMDFLTPYYTEYFTAIYKKPHSNSKVDVYLKPYKWQVWAAIATSIPVGALAAYLVERMSPAKKRSATPEKFETFTNNLFYSYGAFLNEPSPYEPILSSTRILLGCYWIFCVVIAATYSANLIAFLSVEIIRPPFNSLLEISDQNEFEFGTYGNSSYQLIFELSKGGVTRKVWDMMKEFQSNGRPVLTDNHSLHLRMVHEGGYAYFSDVASLELELENTCELTLIKERFAPLQYAIGLQNNSAYTSSFDYGMLKMIDDGLILKWKTRYWLKRKRCDPPSKVRALSLKDIQGVFYIGAALLLLATFMLMIEKLYSNKQKILQSAMTVCTLGYSLLRIILLRLNR